MHTMYGKSPCTLGLVATACSCSNSLALTKKFIPLGTFLCWTTGALLKAPALQARERQLAPHGTSYASPSGDSDSMTSTATCVALCTLDPFGTGSRSRVVFSCLPRGTVQRRASATILVAALHLGFHYTQGTLLPDMTTDIRTLGWYHGNRRVSRPGWARRHMALTLAGVLSDTQAAATTSA